MVETHGLAMSVESIYFIIEGELTRVTEMQGGDVVIGQQHSGMWVGAAEYITCGTWVADYVSDSCHFRIGLAHYM